RCVPSVLVDRGYLASRYSLSLSRRPASFFFNAAAATEIYTLSLHDALPICSAGRDLEIDAVVMEAESGHGRRIPPVEVEGIPARGGQGRLEVRAVTHDLAGHPP